MSISHYLSFLNFILRFLIHSLTDIIVIISVVIYIAAERKRSLLMTIILTGGLVLTTLITLLCYSYIQELIRKAVHVSENMSTILSMVLVLVPSIFVVFLGYYLTNKNISTTLRSYRFLPATIFFGMINFIIILAVTVTVLFILPVTPVLRDILNGSVILRTLATGTTIVERKLNNLSGKGPYHTALSVTVKPNNSARVFLNFSASSTRTVATQPLVSAIHDQRLAVKVPVLQDFPDLDQLASRISTEFANSGYISRSDIKGATLFDILDRFDISYQNATMLVSFAQNDQLAFDQWMSIPQYRQIITHPQYTMIGSAVTQAAPFGNIYLLIFLK